jgi:uncharacterized membrane protein YphA (DoxX/SURF4 family)
VGEIPDILDFILHLTRTRPQWGVIPLRVSFGILLVLHSIDLVKRQNLEGRVMFFSLDGWGLRWVTAAAVLTGLLGVLMIPGIMTRLSGGVILAMTLGASIMHLVKFKTVLSPRFKLAVAGAMIFFIFSGSGKYSMDWLIASKIEEKYPNDKVHAYIHAETDLPDTPWWW